MTTPRDDPAAADRPPSPPRSQGLLDVVFRTPVRAGVDGRGIYFDRAPRSADDRGTPVEIDVTVDAAEQPGYPVLRVYVGGDLTASHDLRPMPALRLVELLQYYLRVPWRELRQIGDDEHAQA